MILADQPELLALATLAAVPASKLAAAFNDPENFFTHVGLEEVARLNDAVKRLGDLSRQMVEAAESYTDYAQEKLAEALAASSEAAVEGA